MLCYEKIIKAERKLDALLLQRLQKNPTAELLNAAMEWSHEAWAAAEELGPMALSDEQLNNGNNLIKSPVFICGVHRSGTTLIRDLLDEHPNLVVLPAEGTYYTNLERKLFALPADKQAFFLGTEWLRRLANGINQPPYWLLGNSKDTSLPYVDFARYLISWWGIINKENAQWPHLAIVLAYASCTGKLAAKFWVDKTPGNERFLNRIWKEMPDAKIIHAIREPIATLASRKLMEPGLNMCYALKSLKLSFSIACKYAVLNNPDFTLVRYEELCENPQKVIEELASFLKIEPLEILSKPTVAGMPSQPNSSFNKGVAGGQIFKFDAQPRHEVLRKQERQLLASYIGELSAKLNYPLEEIGYFKKFYLRLRYRLL